MSILGESGERHELQLLRNAAGDPIEVVGSWNDITARKQIGEALVAAQDRLVRVLSSAPAVIYSFKATGDYAPIIISENIKTLLGYEPREYLENADFWRWLLTYRRRSRPALLAAIAAHAPAARVYVLRTPRAVSRFLACQ